MHIRLRSQGFETFEAYDGAEGLRAAIERRPDAIVLDVRMPRMDGLATLTSLRSEPVTLTKISATCGSGSRMVAR